jgi:hypothetical protein
VDKFNQLEKSLDGGSPGAIKIIKFNGGSILKGG